MVIGRPPRAQRQARHGFNHRAGLESQREALCQRGQAEDGLSQREGHAGADPRPQGKRDVAEFVASCGVLRHEAFRHEMVRLFPEQLVPVQQLGGHEHQGTGPDLMVLNLRPPSASATAAGRSFGRG
jgi:hypothetical protein